MNIELTKDELKDVLLSLNSGIYRIQNQYSEYIKTTKPDLIDYTYITALKNRIAHLRELKEKIEKINF